MAKRPSFARESHQARVFQFLQMERERGGRQSEPLADLAGRHPILAGLNQEPVDIEAGLLCERCQGRQGF